MTWSASLQRLKCRRASAAVEFALVLPMFLALLFGITVFGFYISAVNCVEQLAAEAARAAVAGLSDSERTSLAQNLIARHASAYPTIEPSRLRLASAATDPATGAFSVKLTYDASNLLLGLSFVPVPIATITRSAAVQRGGY